MKGRKDFKIITFMITAICASMIGIQLLNSFNGELLKFNENKALNFLLLQLTNYSDDKWLCREHNGSNTYWIYNDNAFAYQILDYYGNKTGNSTLTEAARKIRRTIEEVYESSITEGNDRIEVLFENQTISFPPFSGTGYRFSSILDHNMSLGNNLVQNPSVEQGTLYPDYWYFSGPYCVRTCWAKNVAHKGSRSLQLISNQTNDHWRSHVFIVSPSEKYLVQCYVKGNITAGEWYLTIRWFNASEPTHENFISEDNRPISLGFYKNWTQITLFDVTPPPNAVYADLLFRSINGTGILYGDSFFVAEILDYGNFIVRNDVKHLQIEDWEDYGDLILIGVLDLYWMNNASYRDCWDKAAKMFDGTGIADKVYNKTGKYETYKLALLIITAITINRTNPILQQPAYEDIKALVENRTEVFGRLQNPENGGVVTHYLEDFIPDPEATENIETTCLAIYACEKKIPKVWIPEFPTWCLLFLLVLTFLAAIVSVRKTKRCHCFKAT